MLLDDVYVETNGVGTFTGVSNGALTTGIGPVSRTITYAVTPLTLQVANIAASQTPVAAALTLTAGTGTTSTTVNGQTVIKLDTPRALRVTSGGNDSGITFNVVGYDVNFQPMTENITGANAGIATGKKAWLYIFSITPSAAVASTCSVGTADIFGLPYFIGDRTSCVTVKWNNTLAQDTGTLTVGDATNPATHTTGDVRGTYAPSSGASDGAKRLVFTQSLSSSQTIAATTTGIYGVTQA